MQTVQVVLDSVETRELELRDGKGYEARGGESGELSGWESEAIWPEG